MGAWPERLVLRRSIDPAQCHLPCAGLCGGSQQGEGFQGDGPRKEAVRLLDPLPLRAVRRACRRPLDNRMTPQPEDEVIRKRQRERARLTAILLGLFVVLMFAITIAKMTINR